MLVAYHRQTKGLGFEMAFALGLVTIGLSGHIELEQKDFSRSMVQLVV